MARKRASQIGKCRCIWFDSTLQEVVGQCLRFVGVNEFENVEVRDFSTPGIFVEADPVQIQQVIINLVRNACEASDEAGGAWVVLSV